MSGPLVAVLDYGIGNLRSAEKALEHVGADAFLTADPAVVERADAVVLPGVGAFGRCREALSESGLDQVALDAVASGRPFLGICVGMQLLYEESDESPGVTGLGVLSGRVQRLPAGVKHPQMQWNQVDLVSESPLFDGHAVPTMFRFSLAPGIPNSSDTVQAPRSLVARMEDADGTAMDLIMINVPFVFVKDPADFAPFFRAIAPDQATGKPDGAKVKAYFDKHPEAARFVEFLDKSAIPASYATSPFYAVHTFYFTNAQGERRPARWTAEPVAGKQGLTEEQIKTLSPDFMQDELRKRAASTPVAWDLYLQFPEEGDPLLDASSPWPEDRKRVNVAQLQLTSVDEPGTKGPCNDVMFDPTAVPDGIETSDDPVLLIRPAAYAVSFSRRMEQ